MTVNQLHKLLGALITRGCGRHQVAVDKETFRHPLESDGCTILNVDSLETHWLPLADDDGGTAFTKAGVERGKSMAVLYGDSRTPLNRKNGDRFRESGSEEGGWCANCRRNFDAHHGEQRLCSPNPTDASR